MQLPRFQIDTRIDEDVIIQDMSELRDGIVERMSRLIINTREQQVRDALIQLGWTPPP